MPVSVGLLLVFPRPPGAFSGGTPKKGKPTSRKSFSVTPVAGDYYHYYYYYYYYYYDYDYYYYYYWQLALKHERGRK